MRKQTKLVAVLSAAALLTIGASMTSFAATGWTEENGTWVYYDKNGSTVTYEWQKSGSNWFYLNGDGEMTTEELIEDDGNYYYVDANGAMVTNQWVAVENEDADGEDEPDHNWYYFQTNGKAYKAPTSGKTSFKTINGKKYAFQEDGKMLFGWVNDSSLQETGDMGWENATYFCGSIDDGAMATGWAKIDVVDTSAEDEDQSYWFYFNPSNGKRVENEKAKGINGKKYAFDTRGVMQSEWYYVEASSASASVASVSGYNYFSEPEDGHRQQKGWFKVVPEKNVNSPAYDEDSTKWFYADNNGSIVSSKIKTINSKKYAFNDKGEMLDGLWALVLDYNNNIIGTPQKIDTASEVGAVPDNSSASIYYFGGGDDGAMKTGNQNVDVDGETYAYTFITSGTGKGQARHDSNYKNAMYIYGRKMKADSDTKLQAFSFPLTVGKTGAAAKGATLINTSGTIMKSRNRVKDADEYYYTTDSAGKVTKVEVKHDDGTYTER